MILPKGSMLGVKRMGPRTEPWGTPQDRLAGGGGKIIYID